MKPIIINTRFRRYAEPSAIADAIDSDHRMASVLNAMCFRHPRVFNRRELMNIGGFAVPGDGVTPFTSFHYWMLRVNDTLPRTGWRVDDTQGFRLAPISARQEVIPAPSPQWREAEFR